MAAGCPRALALSVGLDTSVLVFTSLNKRRDGIHSSVPVSPALLKMLDMVHGIRELQGSASTPSRTSILLRSR